jgi:hypothetical protein
VAMGWVAAFDLARAARALRVAGCLVVRLSWSIAAEVRGDWHARSRQTALRENNPWLSVRARPWAADIGGTWVPTPRPVRAYLRHRALDHQRRLPRSAAPPDRPSRPPASSARPTGIPPDTQAHAADHPGLPPEAPATQRHARALGCDHVLFDADAD